MSARIAAAALVVLLGGCALTQKRPPVQIRYFTPEAVSAPGSATEPGPAAELQLRLGRVQAASYIGDRIAFRDASAEIGYYGTLRWTEPPEEYLRRAVARALFEQRAVREIISGAGPALELDLEAFEELRAPRHAARVVVTWRLRGDRTVLMQRTLTVERPIESDDPAEVASALAAAMAEALADVVDAVVPVVLTELAATPAPP